MLAFKKKSHYLIRPTLFQKNGREIWQQKRVILSYKTHGAESFRRKAKRCSSKKELHCLNSKPKDIKVESRGQRLRGQKDQIWVQIKKL